MPYIPCDDSEMVRLCNARDHRIGHAGIVTRGKRLRLNPPGTSGRGKVEWEDLLVIDDRVPGSGVRATSSSRSPARLAG